MQAYLQHVCSSSAEHLDTGRSDSMPDASAVWTRAAIQSHRHASHQSYRGCNQVRQRRMHADSSRSMAMLMVSAWRSISTSTATLRSPGVYLSSEKETPLGQGLLTSMPDPWCSMLMHEVSLAVPS